MTVLKKTFIILFASITSVHAATAQDFGDGITLKQCLEFALEGNHLIKQAKYDEAIAAAKTKEVKANMLPQINASVGITDNLSLPVIMLPGELVGEAGKNIPVEFGSPYEAGAAIELSQVIFNPALFVGIKTAKNAEELSLLKSRLTKEELVYNVSVIFYDILHGEQQLISIVSNLNMQDSLYSRTVLRVKQDLTREIDLNRIKVGITNLQVHREQLAAIIDQQKRYLKILVGLPLDVPLVLNNSTLQNFDLPSNLINEAYDMTDKAELVYLQKEKDVSRLNIKYINSQYLPSLSFVAAGGYQFQSDKLRLSNSESWFDHSLIGLRLSIPIFDGMSKQKQVRQMDLNIRKLDEEIEFTKQSIRVHHENAKQQLSVGYQAVDAQENNLRLAEKVYDQSRLLYQEGLYNITDLLQTELTLREAQVAYWSEVIRYKKAQLDLMKAEGTLDNLLK